MSKTERLASDQQKWKTFQRVELKPSTGSPRLTTTLADKLLPLTEGEKVLHQIEQEVKRAIQRIQRQITAQIGKTDPDDEAA